MTPEEQAKWIGEFITKNNAKLTEIQRQNFQLIQHTLLTQRDEINNLLKRQGTV